MLSQQYFAQNGCPQKSLRCWRRNDESKCTLGVFHQGAIAFLTFVRWERVAFTEAVSWFKEAGLVRAGFHAH